MLKLLFGGLISLFRSRRDLALENLVLRHQLHVVLRTNPSPSLLDQDRIFSVWTRWLWPSRWRDHLVIVRPSTVLRRHRKGWRLYWSWRSRTKLGRPRRNNETRDLIARMGREVGDRAHPG
jgi:putative transposase